jgi:caspase domain-containing protein
MTRRVAVIIGIENTVGMRALPGAVQGAREMADWAHGEGWEIVYLTDEGDKVVTRTAILGEIQTLVESRTVSQLLLFFAGHGQCWGLDSDFWILSGGTRDVDAGISVHGSITLARQSGIPEIAVFADACRLVGQANDAALKLISGPIFPPGDVARQGNVDQFYATLPTQAAQELQRRTTAGATREQAESDLSTAIVEANGMFTECLLNALRGNDKRAKSRLPNGRIVVGSERLAEALKFSLPRATGPLPGGFAQTPDCRPESNQVLAEVQAATECQLVIEARLTDGSPADGTRLEVLRYDGQSPTKPFITEARVNSWSVSKNLAWGNVYGVQAELADHLQDPESPNPLQYMAGDETVKVTMVPEGRPPSTLRSPVDSILERADLPVTDLGVDTAYVLAPDGERLGRAPGEGVFSVVNIDRLTGDVLRTEQYLREGDKPFVTPPASSDETARAIGEAAALPGRRGFETKTGLSITGVPSVEVYAPDSQPETFKENRMIHVRCASQTSSLIVDLGEDRYAALACFEQFVGRVRVGPLGVENLLYLPAVVTEDAVTELGDDRETKQVQTALAVAEAAARNGRFEIAIDETGPVAKILSQSTHWNPLYGVFAAYGYHQAGNRDAIYELIDHFVNTRQAVPFDVVMLSGVDPSEIPTGVAPGYPLLTEGWTYLDPDLHPAVAAAQRSMAPTLWATIVGDAGRLLGEAVAQGKLDLWGMLEGELT